MNIISGYRMINRSTLNMLESTNRIKKVECVPEPEYVRLKFNPFVLTENTKRACKVVNAHNLNQYKNYFHTFKVENDVDAWLLHLLDIDKRELC